MKTLLTTVMALVIAGTAHAATFTFENGSNGGVVTGETVDGITLDSVSAVTSNGANTQAVYFDSLDASNGIAPVNDPDLLAPFFPDNGSGDYGTLVTVAEPGSTAPDDNFNGGTLTFMFDQVVKFLSIDIFDLEGDSGVVKVDGVVVATGGQSADGGVTELLASTAFFGTTITVSSNTSFAVDNLSVAAVPVPASLPLLLAGFGGLALMKRRRKS